MKDETLFYVLFVLVLSIGAFLLGLQIAYGWFKIGPRIKNQQEIIRLLKKIAGEQ